MTRQLAAAKLLVLTHELAEIYDALAPEYRSSGPILEAIESVAAAQRHQAMLAKAE